MSIQSATPKTTTRKPASGRNPIVRNQMDRFLKLATENQADGKTENQGKSDPQDDDSSTTPRMGRPQSSLPGNSIEASDPVQLRGTPDQELLKPYRRQREVMKIEHLNQGQTPQEAPKVKELQLPQFGIAKSSTQEQYRSPTVPPSSSRRSEDGSSSRLAGPDSSVSLESQAEANSTVSKQLRSAQPDVLHQHLIAGLQRLDDQAHYVNQLSADLESAMVDLRSLSVGVSRLRQSLESLEKTPSAQPTTLLEGTSVQLPYIKQDRDGRFKVRFRQVDLLQAERDAASTAQFLRERGKTSLSPPQKASPPQKSIRTARAQSVSSARSSVSQPSQSQLETAPTIQTSSAGADQIGAAQRSDRFQSYQRQVGQKLSDRKQSHQRQPYRKWRWLREILRFPRNLATMLPDAAVWIVAAASLRIGLQLLLSANPALLAPISLLLITSVLIATYQITLMARSGQILGYRLLLVLIGLLLGGRL